MVISPQFGTLLRDRAVGRLDRRVISAQLLDQDGQLAGSAVAEPRK